MCALLLAGVHTQVVGSLTYFQRALVVSAAAAVHGPTFRTSFFAALNTWSAAAIVVMQVKRERGRLSGDVGRQSCSPPPQLVVAVGCGGCTEHLPLDARHQRCARVLTDVLSCAVLCCADCLLPAALCDELPAALDGHVGSTGAGPVDLHGWAAECSDLPPALDGGSH